MSKLDPALLQFATPAQRRIAEAVIREGSYSGAARALDMHHSAVRTSVQRLTNRAEPVDEPEPIDSGEVRKLRQQLAEQKRKTEAYKLLVEEQEKLVADFQASRFDFTRQKIAKYTGKGSFARVALGDTHGSSIDKPAFNAFLSDMEALAPRQVVHLGDFTECGGWLAAHHTTSYVAQTEYTYSDDIIAANLMTDEIQKVCPTSEIHYIEGNHDARVATWAITMAQKNRADVDLLIRQLAPQHLLSIKKRGIHWWSRGDVHPGSVIGGTLKLGRCYFTHPQSSSKHHAATTVAKFGANVVYGHTHRADFYPGSDVTGREYAAWSPGCLCKLRKYWHHTEPFRHNHGYHVQLVKPDGSFLGINVPIIGGKSYLTGLLKMGSAA